MDRLAELLGTEVDLDALSQEEIEARRADLREAVRETHAGEKTAETVDLIKQGVAAVKATEDVIAARAEEAARIIAESDEALASMGDDEAADDEDLEGEETVEGETEATETDAEVVELPAADAPAEVEEAAEPIAAAAKPAAKPAKRALVRGVRVPARSQPRATNRNGVTMRVSGEVPGMSIGRDLANLDETNHVLFDKWFSMRKSRDGVPHTVATIDYKDIYPEERQISGGDAFEVANKLMGYLADRNERFRERAVAISEGTMVASGGVPGPPEPNYNVITYGQADRPIRDGLPSVLMKRGATIYNTSPVLSAVTLDTGSGAIGTVTSAQDLATATKDVQEVPAPVQKTVTVEAETMRWSQGNFADRFLPEWTAAFMKLGQVAFARHNEALRLADIKANCTQYTDTVAHLGAYRDLKRQVLGEMEQLEDLLRDFAVPICLILPEYLPALLATDLIAQQPGDEAYTVTEESVRRDVEGWDPSLHVIWAKDSIRGRLSVTPSGQSPRTPGFDEDVEWALFPEGAFVYGDGGQLDLGILRDTVVSATNKFQTFFEGWEALLPLVDKSICFWNTSSLCANGVTQASAVVSGLCEPQGS